MTITHRLTSEAVVHEQSAEADPGTRSRTFRFTTPGDSHERVRLDVEAGKVGGLGESEGLSELTI